MYAVHKIKKYIHKTRGRDRAVGIATYYRLDSRGLNPDGGEIFRTLSDRPWDPSRLL
jgi:hypothetical protein